MTPKTTQVSPTTDADNTVLVCIKDTDRQEEATPVTHRHGSHIAVTASSVFHIAIESSAKKRPATTSTGSLQSA